MNNSADSPENFVGTPPTSLPPTHRGFWNLIATQFQGAFSDNALKNLVIFLILGMGLPHERANRMISLVGIIFAIPFLLFSLAGGFFADRFSKRTVTICTKYMEIVVMILALAGLAASSLSLQFAAIFLVCTQAALFGGAKYGLLPELLRESELSWGNGILELGTFLAALSGTMAGDFLADTFRGRQGWSGALLLAIALIGLATSYGISRVPAAAPTRKYTWNPFTDFRDQLRIIRSDRLLALAVVGNIYFWYLAALIVLVVVVYGTGALGLSALRTSYLQAAMAIGIGAGSVAAGYFSNKQIEYGIIPYGAGGMAAACAVLALPHLGYWTVFSVLAALGFFAGFFRGADQRADSTSTADSTARVGDRYGEFTFVGGNRNGVGCLLCDGGSVAFGGAENFSCFVGNYVDCAGLYCCSAAGFDFAADEAAARAFSLED